MLVFHWYIFSTETLDIVELGTQTSISDSPAFIVPNSAKSGMLPSPVPRLTTSDSIPDGSDDISASAANDFLFVEILDTSNTVLETLHTLTDDDTRNQWVASGFSLDAYKGQTIRIRFRATNNATSHTAFFIDDISLDIGIAVTPSCTFIPIISKKTS